jgi:hypothetical protein
VQPQDNLTSDALLRAHTKELTPPQACATAIIDFMHLHSALPEQSDRIKVVVDFLCTSYDLIRFGAKPFNNFFFFFWCLIPIIVFCILYSDCENQFHE